MMIKSGGVALLFLLILCHFVNGKGSSSSSSSGGRSLNLPAHLRTNNPLLQIPCALQLQQETAAAIETKTKKDKSKDNKNEENENKITPLKTFVDTGAQVSALSYRAAKRAGLVQMMDQRYAGHAQGIGRCRVFGRLPAGAVLIHSSGFTMAAPPITIYENYNPQQAQQEQAQEEDDVDLLLGLDFLRDYQAIIDLRQDQMNLIVKQKTISIPFIKPRATLSFMIQDEPQEPQQKQEEGEDGEWLENKLCVNRLAQGLDIEEEEEGEEHGGGDGPIDMSGI